MVLYYSLNCLWDLVNILRFDDWFQMVFKNTSEIVLELRATEVGQDLRPLWRILSRKFVKLIGRVK